ncbi:MAG: glycosyltransferase family 9 protein [Candidatus Rokubacteria bacterium]|nr:glycosyltransferase family 9 protein [Candidatus Rokubacteria bacterium]
MATLVVHPGALGDVLLAVPALRALRGGAPGSPLVLAAQPRIAALLLALGLVDRGLSVDTLGLEALFADDPGPVSLHGVVGVERIVSWLGAADPVFVRRLRTFAPEVIVAPSSRPDAPVWEHLLSTVASKAPAGREPVAVPAALLEDARRHLRALGWDGLTPLLMVHPGAGGLAKRWPPEAFAEALGPLGRRPELALVIHEGPADADAVTALCRHTEAPVLRLTHPTLQLLAGVMTQIAGYLGNDSGPSHLAAAVGAPSLVLFTREALAWRPWARDARVLTVRTSSVDPNDVRTVGTEVLKMLGQDRRD